MFNLEPVALKSVRPMIFRTVNLDEEEGLDLKGSDKKQQQVVHIFVLSTSLSSPECVFLQLSPSLLYRFQQKVEKFLREYVEELLMNDVDALLTGHRLQPELPLVRVRVIYREAITQQQSS